MLLKNIKGREGENIVLFSDVEPRIMTADPTLKLKFREKLPF